MFFSRRFGIFNWSHRASCDSLILTRKHEIKHQAHPQFVVHCVFYACALLQICSNNLSSWSPVSADVSYLFLSSLFFFFFVFFLPFFISLSLFLSHLQGLLQSPLLSVVLPSLLPLSFFLLSHLSWALMSATFNISYIFYSSPLNILSCVFFSVPSHKYLSVRIIAPLINATLKDV